MKNLHSSLKSLLRTPLFTVAVVTTLAIAIGPAAVIFGLIDQILLEPLPYDQPDRIAVLRETAGEEADVPVTPATFLTWEEQNELFSELAAYYTTRASFAPEGGRAPERVPSARVGPSFFRVLGIEPAIGRGLRPEDATPGNDRVVILGHGFWRRWLGSDPGIVGQSLTFDSKSFQVIGIAPPELAFPRETEAWFPYTMSEDERGNFGSHFLGVVGRLEPDGSLSQAQAHMDTIASRLAAERPANKDGWGVNVVSLEDDLVGDVRPSLLMLQAAVLLVLLIAAGNVAGLQVAHLLSRRRELALRTALGAGRSSLVGLLSAESTILGILAGSLGLVIARAGLHLVESLLPDELPRMEGQVLDLSVILCTLGLSALLGSVLGVLTALKASRADLGLVQDLEGVGSTASRRHRRFLETLVVAEIGLALTLLVGAGLLTGSLTRLLRVDPGIETEDVLTGRTSLPGYRYPELRQQVDFYDRLLEGAARLPGVVSVGLINSFPADGSRVWENGLHLGADPLASARDYRSAFIRWASPGYFETLGIPLLRGRSFRPSDGQDSSRVLVVDRAFADEFFPGEGAVGQKIFDIGLGSAYIDGEPWEIVGVVGNVRETSLTDPEAPHYYVSYRQAPFLTPLSVAVRTDADPVSLQSALLGVYRSLDPSLPVYRVQTLEETVAKTVAARRFTLFLFGAFATVALLLAMVGIYGVIAYTVAHRTREIGVRMALGAKRSDILNEVLLRGLAVAVCGVILGLLASWSLGRAFASFLYDVSPTDPWTLTVVSAVLVLTATAATYFPARRAMLIDPREALLGE